MVMMRMRMMMMGQLVCGAYGHYNANTQPGPNNFLIK